MPMVKRVARHVPHAFLLLCGLALVAPAAQAATHRSANNLVLAAGETVNGNLYATGTTVRIDGTVTGDLIAAGTSVELGPSAKVDGDVLAAGQLVSIGGTVGGDVRAAGFVVRTAADAKVGGEFTAAGFSLEQAKSSAVAGDLAAFGYQALLDGDTQGNALVRAAALELEGTVAGNVDATVSAQGEGEADMGPMFSFMATRPARSAQPGLKLGPAGHIGGRLVYQAPYEITLPASAAGQGTHFVVDEAARAAIEEAAARSEDVVGAAAAAAARARSPMNTVTRFVKRYIALLVIGLLLLWLLPRVVAGGRQRLSELPLKSFGWGFVTVVGSFFAFAALILLTLFALGFLGLVQVGPLVLPTLAISAIVGTLIFWGMLLLAWFGEVVVSQWLGERVFTAVSPTATPKPWVPFVLGAAIYILLRSLPFAGILVQWVAVFFGLGALVLYWWPQRTGAGPAAATPAA